jgi:plasmid maintenance system antidote protein VapI
MAMHNPPHPGEFITEVYLFLRRRAAELIPLPDKGPPEVDHP